MTYLYSIEAISPASYIHTCISQGKRCTEKGGLVIYLNDIYNYTQLPICNNFENKMGGSILKTNND